jgi:hypothetical protein
MEGNPGDSSLRHGETPLDVNNNGSVMRQFKSF